MANSQAPGRTLVHLLGVLSPGLRLVWAEQLLHVRDTPSPGDTVLA